MVKYPIRVAGSRYRGGDPNKRAKALEENRNAALLTRVINEMLQQQTAPVRMYSWQEIAGISGLPYEIVQTLGYSIDCGSGGFTAYRHDLTMEAAISAAERGERA